MLDGTEKKQKKKNRAANKIFAAPAGDDVLIDTVCVQRKISLIRRRRERHLVFCGARLGERAYIGIAFFSALPKNAIRALRQGTLQAIEKKKPLIGMLRGKKSR